MRSRAGTRSGDGPDFEEFVAVRSPALLRTAYLLTGDPELAERLLQAALARAWFGWGHLDDRPEPYVRRLILAHYTAWWRPWSVRRDPAAPTDRDAELWDALGRLPRRLRAVVVLRYFDDLSEEDTAELLEIPLGTVRSRAARALARLGVEPAVDDRAEPHRWEPA